MRLLARGVKVAMAAAAGFGAAAFALQEASPAARLMSLSATDSAAAARNPEQMIAAARPGDSIVLPASTGGSLLITNRNFSPAIRIDANAATLNEIVIRNSSGIRIDRGRIVGRGGRSYGVNIVASRDIRIANMTITGAHRGIVIGRSQGILVSGNTLTGLISDGINIALSSNVRVERNSCSNFSPAPNVFTEGGDRVADGDHPDCIQAWSRPDSAPVSDVVITGNRMSGRMQGIFFGNHVRGGVDDGGFDRITIEDNVVTASSSHGITLTDARSSVVRRNVISTVPGAVSTRPPYNPLKATLRIVRPTNVEACGNQVADQAEGFGLQPCRAAAL